MEELNLEKDTLCIYDWDGTLQSIGTIKSSIGFFIDTLLTPLNIGVTEINNEDDKIGTSLKDILEDDNSIICTSRAKIYTLAVRLACFIRLPSFKWFDYNKICTSNSDFFYNENTKRRLDCSDKEHGNNAITQKINTCLNYINNYSKLKHVLYFDEDLEYGSCYRKLHS